MTKPDWCPADVCEAAARVEFDAINATWNGPAKETRAITETIIARAILAERERALEEAAVACERTYGINAAAIRALKETP